MESRSGPATPDPDATAQRRSRAVLRTVTLLRRAMFSGVPENIAQAP